MTTDASPYHDPVLRIVPGPRDINSNGHIFGGWVLSQMDMAGGVVAGREAEGAVATVAVDAMKFIRPILIQDLISVYATVQRRGNTSITILIEVFAKRAHNPDELKVTEALFTFVALDENHRPRPFPKRGS